MMLIVQVPIALARGSSGLVDKVCAMLHSLFLETGSMESMKSILWQSVSATSDMGTEFSAAEFRVDNYKVAPDIPLSLPNFLFVCASLGHVWLSYFPNPPHPTRCTRTKD